MRDPVGECELFLYVWEVHNELYAYKCVWLKDYYIEDFELQFHYASSLTENFNMIAKQTVVLETTTLKL